MPAATSSPSLTPSPSLSATVIFVPWMVTSSAVESPSSSRSSGGRERIPFLPGCRCPLPRPEPTTGSREAPGWPECRFRCWFNRRLGCRGRNWRWRRRHARGIERVRPGRDLLAVRDVVTVGVVKERVRAVGEQLLGVVEPVAVGIGVEGVGAIEVDLVAVAHAIRVTVRQRRIGAKRRLQLIGQPVRVGIDLLRER